MHVLLAIPAPYVSPSEYAKMTGETEGAIRGQLDKGDIPEYRHANAVSRTKGQGKRVTRYVDLTKITVERLRASGVSVFIK
jgi:hypothetical protein